ncbi:MAG: rod-binding protein [Rubellimicrobium sp.]|nr:rod-binding protein [Rubellimicrobium sp.]
MIRPDPPFIYHDLNRRGGAPPGGGARNPRGGGGPPHQSLRRVAEALETRFLSDMLRTAGLDAASKSMGGGPAEGHFASFLTEARAEALVRDGGIGLAESIYRSLVRPQHDG